MLFILHSCPQFMQHWKTWESVYLMKITRISDSGPGSNIAKTGWLYFPNCLASFPHFVNEWLLVIWFVVLNNTQISKKWKFLSGIVGTSFVEVSVKTNYCLEMHMCRNMDGSDTVTLTSLFSFLFFKIPWKMTEQSSSWCYLGNRVPVKLRIWLFNISSLLEHSLRINVCNRLWPWGLVSHVQNLNWEDEIVVYHQHLFKIWVVEKRTKVSMHDWILLRFIPFAIVWFRYEKVLIAQIMPWAIHYSKHLRGEHITSIFKDMCVLFLNLYFHFYFISICSEFYISQKLIPV